MATRQLLWIVTPVLLGWSLLTMSCGRQTVCAVVLSCDENIAWATASPASAERPLRNGDLLRVGERAGSRTNPGELVPLAISLLPGVDVALSGESAITLTQLHFAKLAGEVTLRETALTWQGGNLVCSLAEADGVVPAHLRVELGDGRFVLAGPGSLCGLWNDAAEGKTRIVCARGFVEVAGELLAAGHFREFSDARQWSRAQPAATEGAAQREIVALRNAEKTLQGLEARRQDAPPRWWR